MPWAASMVYLADTPGARAVLEADPVLSPHVYAVGAARVDFPPLLAAETDGDLLVLRSPGRPRDRGLLVDAFDWTGFDGALSPRLAGFRRHLPGPAARIAPPDSHLRWLEDLAARVAGTVVWYQAEAPEGEADAEMAWVLGFARDWHFDTTIRSVSGGAILYLRKGPAFLRLRGTDAEAIPENPLGAGLLHLGLHLDSPWFSPHAPGFDWESRRLWR